MLFRWVFRVLVGFILVMPLAAEAPRSGIEKFGNTPLVFEPNYGQVDSSVRFLSRGDRFGFFLTETESIVSIAGSTPAVVRMQLVGQNPHPRISGSGVQAGASHYFKGADASKWQESVPHFLKVDYQAVYPGIDLTYYGNQRQLEYDFTVGPHVSPKAIELKFTGVDQIEIGDRGDLILHTPAGEIRHQHPRVYQNRHGVEEAVEGQFVLLESDTVGFRIGKYDSGLPLIIDPKFIYSTYFGGDGPDGDIGIDLKVDAQGTTYVTGYTSSMDFFSTNLSPTAPGGRLDAFVMKVDSTGQNILSAMYFGGSLDDEGHRIMLDNSGSVYITGYTTSADFPIVNGFQTKPGGKKDAYIMKIDHAVSQILFSSYIGGSQDDQPFGLSIDTNNNIYISGETSSPNFPLVNPILGSFGGGRADAFVTKIAPDGTRVYSTYLGGIGNDHSFDVTADSDGNAYVVGYTTAALPNIVRAVYGTVSDPEQAFLAKLSPDGRSLLAFAYIGGFGIDEAVRVVLDSNQNIIISGYTSAPNFPVVNAIQPINGGDTNSFDIFLMKLLPDLSDIVFSTYIGSDGSESAPGLAVDPDGNIYLAGFTSSFEFPVVNGINIGTSGGNLHGDRDAYVMKLSPNGRILFSTYVGGSSSDGAVGIALDTARNIYVTGFTFSGDFPLENEFQSDPSGASDGILMKIDATDVTVDAPVVIPDHGGTAVATVGSSNKVQFAHATLEVPVGAKRPAGLALLDLRQGGAELGEAAFPLLPFITDVRVFVNESATQATNIAIVNPSADPVDLNFFLADRTGAQSNFGGITIPAKSSFAQPVTGLPFRLPTSAAGTLTLSTTAPVAALAFRTFTESNGSILLSYLPLISPAETETRPTTIAQYTSDLKWGSGFILVNNTETPMSGVVRFYSTGADQTDPTLSATPVEVTLDRGNFTEVPYNLAPLASDNFNTNGSETALAGYAQIIPDAGTFTPVASNILSYAANGVGSLHAIVEAQIPANDFRLYTEYSGDFEHNENRTIVTSFSLSNPSNTPTDVTLTLVKLDGTPTGLSTTFTLAARGHISNYVHRLAGFSSMPNPFQGVMLVHATGSGVTAFGMRGRLSENGTFVGTTTGPIKENPGSGTTVIFPHVLDGGGYGTRFILLADASGTGTSGTLSFANENGDPVPLAIESGAVAPLWPPAPPPQLGIPQLTKDLNGDGKADIVWETFFGNVYAGLMNGSSVTSQRFIANIWTGWTIVGGGDFNGDGKSDILWHDLEGNAAIWMMDGIRVDSFSTVGNPGADWSIAGAGDFNGDGKADILWHSDAGVVMIWFMNGITVTGTSTLGNIWTGWSIVGIGDFNGDGKSDILWRDVNGNTTIWLMNGGTVLSFTNVGNRPPDVSVAGVGDFNGDGKADILWRDSSGNVSMWLMNGTSILNSSTVANIINVWSIVGTGDFNGDGKADILWRNFKGTEVIWFMNGSTISSFQEIGI
jgi:FG-GAP-like repeat/Beta-propeller repeat